MGRSSVEEEKGERMNFGRREEESGEECGELKGESMG
jgi:hypothetical protein